MLQVFAGRGQILVPVLQKMGQIPVERFPVLGRVGENFGQNDGVDRADLGTKTTVHTAQRIHVVSIDHAAVGLRVLARMHMNTAGGTRSISVRAAARSR